MGARGSDSLSACLITFNRVQRIPGDDSLDATLTHGGTSDRRLWAVCKICPPLNETLIRSPRTRYRRAPVNNSGNPQRLTKEQGLAQCCSSHALRLLCLELQWPRLTGSAQVRNISLIAPGLGKRLIELNSPMWRIPPAFSASFAKSNMNLLLKPMKCEKKVDLQQQHRLCFTLSDSD